MQDVPIAKPTILTGQNDAGKSALLLSIELLLSSRNVVPNDFTYVQIDAAESTAKTPDNLLDSENLADVEVDSQTINITGVFSTTDAEQAEFEVGTEVRIRKQFSRTASPQYDMLKSVPKDERLRGLESQTMVDLKNLCAELGIDADGPKNAKSSWLDPLEVFATTRTMVAAWTLVPKRMLATLPRFISFSSTAEPDPQADVRAALSESFDRHIQDEKLAGQVLKVEEELSKRLKSDADELREHILERCDGLNDIAIIPKVSMKQGFAGVDLTASRVAGEHVEINASGAGRRRLITLAIWEWVGDLLAKVATDPASPARSIVIVYDEPDTHLDYRRQREMMTLFRKQCLEGGVRMVVATHSLNLIDRVDIGSVIHLKLENDRTKIERLIDTGDQEVDHYLADVAIAMGLRNSTLLNERCFVVVEGATEEQCLPLLARLVFEMPLQSLGLTVLAADGNEGALKVAGLLKKRGREVAIVVDADTVAHVSTKKMFRPDRLRGQGFDMAKDVHFLGDKELEDWFSDDQWATTANSNWPRDDGRAWSRSDMETVRAGGKFSSDLHSMLGAACEEGPQTKPEILLTLVRGLKDISEVPTKLVAVLRDVAKLTENK